MKTQKTPQLCTLVFADIMGYIEFKYCVISKISCSRISATKNQMLYLL
jgi:hypothetical protein